MLPRSWRQRSPRQPAVRRQRQRRAARPGPPPRAATPGQADQSGSSGGRPISREPAQLGSFSGCDNYDRTPAAYCSGLPADLRAQWWAYPYMWPDTATEQHRALGGYYDPGSTVWISGGQMHIRLFRTTSWIHSAAVVPKASIGLLYGKYVERFMVSPDSAPGYRGAHLLWPTGDPIDYEVDYPENEWDLPLGFCVHVHSVFQKIVANSCPNAQWTQWHTTEIDWWPGNLTFYLDGREIYHITGSYVPTEPMSWIIQNESALTGARRRRRTPPRSSTCPTSPFTPTREAAGDSGAGSGERHPVDDDVRVTVDDPPGRTAADRARQPRITGRIAEVIDVGGHAAAEHHVRGGMPERGEPSFDLGQARLIQPGLAVLGVGQAPPGGRRRCSRRPQVRGSCRRAGRAGNPAAHCGKARGSRPAPPG